MEAYIVVDIHEALKQLTSKTLRRKFWLSRISGMEWWNGGMEHWNGLINAKNLVTS